MSQHLVISKPNPDEYPEWFAGEINPVAYNDLIPDLYISHDITRTFLSSLGDEQLHYRYAEGKWTIKEMWQHVIDVERVLTYRALRWSRNDNNVLHGFDHLAWVHNSNANNRNWQDILDEYSDVRKASTRLFKSFDMGMIMRRGTAGKSTLTVRAVGFLLLGHELHHANTIREKYLDKK